MEVGWRWPGVYLAGNRHDRRSAAAHHAIAEALPRGLADGWEAAVEISLHDIVRSEQRYPGRCRRPGDLRWNSETDVRGEGGWARASHRVGDARDHDVHEHAGFERNHALRDVG